MTSTVTNNVKASALVALALAIGRWASTSRTRMTRACQDLALAGIGMLVMAIGVVLALRAARTRLPTWAARTGLVLGVLLAMSAAFLIHQAAVTAPLFAHPQDVPSAADSATSPQDAAAVERTRAHVRA